MAALGVRVLVAAWRPRATARRCGSWPRSRACWRWRCCWRPGPAGAGPAAEPLPRDAVRRRGSRRATAFTSTRTWRRRSCCTACWPARGSSRPGRAAGGGRSPGRAARLRAPLHVLPRRSPGHGAGPARAGGAAGRAPASGRGGARAWSVRACWGFAPVRLRGRARSSGCGWAARAPAAGTWRATIPRRRAHLRPGEQRTTRASASPTAAARPGRSATSSHWPSHWWNQDRQPLEGRRGAPRLPRDSRSGRARCWTPTLRAPQREGQVLLVSGHGARAHHGSAGMARHARGPGGDQPPPGFLGERRSP